jgi:hypothetical protein
MHHKLQSRLDHSFELTHDLVAHLHESALGLDLPNLPSNCIAGQIWCIVGARESYTRAIQAGVWDGFVCSLADPRRKSSVLDALDATRTSLAQLNFAHFTDVQLDLGFGLLEHEVQHHGQLIRFVYANGLTFPESWNKRYTV